MAKKDNIVNPNSINSIAETTVFSGTFETASDINIRGKFEGTVKTKNKLVLGEQGEIKGEIHCKNALISGTVIGKVYVDELITLQSTAILRGDIITSKIAIEVGAVFDGTCSMDKENTIEGKK